MRQTLRKFQETAIESLRDGVRRGIKGQMLVAPTGAGKTTIAAFLIESAVERGSSVLFLAHRRELIGQASRRLDEMGIDHGIIQAKHPRHKPHLPVQVGSVQTVVNRDFFKAPNLVIVDECFPAGTLVDGIPIERIKVGDTVQAFCHKTEQIVEKPVLHTFRSKPLSMCVVHLSSGQRIACTHNHPFFTGLEYTPAIALNQGDLLLTNETKNLLDLPSGVHSKILEQPDDSVLLEGVQASGVQSEGQGGAPSLQNMQRHGGVAREAVKPDCTRIGIVLPTMQGEVGSRRQSEVCCIFERVQQEVRLGKNEDVQSDAATRSARENGKYSEDNRLETANSRWQWAPDNSADNACRGSRLGDGGCGLLPRDEMEIPKDRHSQQDSDDSNRGRRRKPLLAPGKGQGLRKGSSVGVVRVDRVEILEQTGDGTFGGMCPDGFVYNIEVDGHHNYFINGILVHNCHRAKADSYTKILNMLGRPVTIGLTATPCRLDGRGLGGDLFQRIVECPQVKELTEMGYLVPSITYAHKKRNMSGFTKQAGDFKAEDVESVMNKPELIGDVVKEWLEKAAGRPTIAFASTVKHSLAIVAAFVAAGVSAAHVDCNTPTDIRDTLLAKLASGEIQVVSNVDIYSEGVDCTAVSCIIDDAITASLVKYLQRRGRGLRPHPGKAECIILDHAGNAYFPGHGLPSTPRVWSLDADRKKKKSVSASYKDTIKVCPKCKAVHDLDQLVCPCGYVFSVRKHQSPVHGPGELEQIHEGDLPVIPESRKRQQYEWFLLQQHLASKRDGAPYSKGYAFMKFQSEFKQRPKRGWREEWVATHADVVIADAKRRKDWDIRHTDFDYVEPMSHAS